MNNKIIGLKILFLMICISAFAIEQRMSTRSQDLDSEMVSSWGRQKDFFINGDFEIISWGEAKNILLNKKCRGKQYHTGWLTVYSDDDKKYLIKQPTIDSFMSFMKEKDLNMDGFGTE